MCCLITRCVSLIIHVKMHLSKQNFVLRRRNSSVSTVTTQRYRRQGKHLFISQQTEILLCATQFRAAAGSTEPPIQWISRAAHRGVKQPGREPSYSLPFSAEVVNARSRTYLCSPVHLHFFWLNQSQQNLHSICVKVSKRILFYKIYQPKFCTQIHKCPFSMNASPASFCLICLPNLIILNLLGIGLRISKTETRENVKHKMRLLSERRVGNCC